VSETLFFPVDRHTDSLKAVASELLQGASKFRDAARQMGLDATKYDQLVIRAEMINRHFNPEG
jgi:hypothetical protein